MKLTLKTILLTISLPFACLVLVASFGCIAQAQSCNRKAVDKSVERLLPIGVCLSEGYTVDKVITGFDFNHDAKEEIAVRYAQYPLNDGTLRYYAVYEMISDFTYTGRKLPSLTAPYIEVLTKSYLDAHSVADSLNDIYPANFDVDFKQDTIFLSHSIPDYYGKTYLYVYDIDKKDWYMKKVRYWMGQLPAWLIRNGKLSEKLYEKIYLDEDKTLNEPISIEQFSLTESKRIAEQESEYLMNNYDVFDWTEE